MSKKTLVKNCPWHGEYFADDLEAECPSCQDGKLSNLALGQPDGDKGRSMGATAGGKASAAKPAPADCEHCRTMHYHSWMQHIGHKGWRAVLHDHPTACHSLRDKIKRTGRADSRARWKQVSR